LRIFHNLAKSEQTHMDAVEALVDRYGVEDPAAGIVSWSGSLKKANHS